MTKIFVSQITLKRDNLNDYAIEDVDEFIKLNVKINDPYYKSRLLDVGDNVTLEEKVYTVDKISFFLHPLDHIDSYIKVGVITSNCEVVVHLT